MLIGQRVYLVMKTELKQSKKENGSAYLLVDLLELNTGTIFNIVDKNVEDMNKLKQMTKYEIDLDLTSSRYGLQLSIANIGKEFGGI